MKTVLIALSSLFVSTIALADARPCRLDLSLKDQAFTQKNVFDGEVLMNKNDSEREALFAKLPAVQRELILLGLSQHAHDTGLSLARLLTDVADLDGTDLNLYRISVKELPSAQVYRVSMGLGENEYGFMVEVVGQAKIGQLPARPMLKIVSVIRDGDTSSCDYKFQ